MPILNSVEMTPRESLEHEWRVEEQRIIQEHAVLMKRLDIEEQKLEAKWGSWLRIPLTVVKLPVYMIMALGYVVAMARGGDVPANFWTYLR